MSTMYSHSVAMLRQAKNKRSSMDRIVYVQEDRFDLPEDLLKLSHEQIRERIKQERQRELEKKKKQMEKLKKVKA